MKFSIPNIPKIKNNMPENFWIIFSGIFLFKAFPNIIAIKSDTIIANIAPKTSIILNFGYSKKIKAIIALLKT